MQDRIIEIPMYHRSIFRERAPRWKSLDEMRFWVKHAKPGDKMIYIRGGNLKMRNKRFIQAKHFRAISQVDLGRRQFSAHYRQMEEYFMVKL